jgi:hypothetical protein
MNASTSVNLERTRVEARWSRNFILPAPADGSSRTTSDTLTSLTHWQDRSNRFGGSYGLDVDIKQHRLVNQRVSAYYNSQCCGLNVDWQSTPGGFAPSNRQLNVGFTLAGIGSFSNPFGSFGGR